MKKLIYAFVLVGLIVFTIPKAANAGCILVFCGHSCWCDDEDDVLSWTEIYCPDLMLQN